MVGRLPEEALKLFSFARPSPRTIERFQGRNTAFSKLPKNPLLKPPSQDISPQLNSVAYQTNPLAKKIETWNSLRPNNTRKKSRFAKIRLRNATNINESEYNNSVPRYRTSRNGTFIEPSRRFSRSQPNDALVTSANNLTVGDCYRFRLNGKAFKGICVQGGPRSNGAFSLIYPNTKDKTVKIDIKSVPFTSLTDVKKIRCNDFYYEDQKEELENKLVLAIQEGDGQGTNGWITIAEAGHNFFLRSDSPKLTSIVSQVRNEAEQVQISARNTQSGIVSTAEELVPGYCYTILASATNPPTTGLCVQGGPSSNGKFSMIDTDSTSSIIDIESNSPTNYLSIESIPCNASISPSTSLTNSSATKKAVGPIKTKLLKALSIGNFKGENGFITPTQAISTGFVTEDEIEDYRDKEQKLTYANGLERSENAEQYRLRHVKPSSRFKRRGGRTLRHKKRGRKYSHRNK